MKRMRGQAAALAALLALGLAGPPAATAATCPDYLNQAAAQRAADTRDADGVYYAKGS